MISLGLNKHTRGLHEKNLYIIILSSCITTVQTHLKLMTIKQSIRVTCTDVENYNKKLE